MSHGGRRSECSYLTLNEHRDDILQNIYLWKAGFRCNIELERQGGGTLPAVA